MAEVSSGAAPSGSLLAPTREPSASPRESFALRHEGDRVVLEGALSLSSGRELWSSLRSVTRNIACESLEIDLSGVTSIDGAVMSLLVELRAELASRDVACALVGASGKVAEIVRLYGGDAPPPSSSEPPAPSAIEHVGGASLEGARAVGRLFSFLGELVEAAWGAVRSPRSANLGSLFQLSERAGADGVPIVALLNFLVGFVMAYQSARQLKLYGANVFVADVVGISVTRELAPLMTAIIVSGRSGASFAAELGTMKVSEEIDALRTMGFAPVRHLVIPRVLALALVTPVLTLLGDVVGVLGGATVGAVSLGVSARGYLAELRTAVFVPDVVTGLVKGAGFGIAIALIGCQQGLATKGGALGVGRRTTSTVVTCLFAIVVIDTLFTMLFRALSL